MDRKKYVILYSAFLFFAVSAMLYCTHDTERENINDKNSTTVQARVETEPVSAGQNDDAADDPAIWINFEEPSNSLILGTNKKAGLNLYNLKGEEVFFIEEGLINNVDVRYGFDLNGEKVDISGGSNRSNNSICLHIIDGVSQQLIPVHSRVIRSDVDEVYGFCFYHSHKTDDYFAFINGKDGSIQQWKLEATHEEKIDAVLVRTLKVDSQPEGMVADDEKGLLYVGEEGKGVWKFQAEPDASRDKTFVKNSGKENPDIEFDVEGLALFYQPDGKGYLIVSSQGNNSYAIFEREGENSYIQSFSISDSEGIDGAEETDGLEASNYSFNNEFPAGMLVVQDGFNFEGDSLYSQNFKLVDWREIAEIVKDEKIDSLYNPYNPKGK
jgi:3-phytase